MKEIGNPAYRATLLHTIVTASNQGDMSYFDHDGLVVIGTWLMTRSLLLSKIVFIHKLTH